MTIDEAIAVLKAFQAGSATAAGPAAKAMADTYKSHLTQGDVAAVPFGAGPVRDDLAAGQSYRVPYGASG